MTAPAKYVGHVHTSGATLVADTAWRPQDLRVVAPGVIASSVAAATASTPAGPTATATPPQPPTAASAHSQQDEDAAAHAAPVQPPAWEAMLKLGSAIAAEARAAVKAETGFK